MTKFNIDKMFYVCNHYISIVIFLSQIYRSRGDPLGALMVPCYKEMCIKNTEIHFYKYTLILHKSYIEGLVQETRNSIANALELLLSCTNSSACFEIN